MSAQNPAPSTQKTPLPTIDQFPEAHRGIFAPQPDKTKDAVQLTDSVAKSLPVEPPFVGVMPRKNFVDEHIFGRMERDSIPHARLSGDEEFLRRVYLDATGTLPEPEEVRKFIAGTTPDKRDRVIDSLIGTEKFAEQWAWFYGDLFKLMNYAGDMKNAFQFWNKEWLQVDRPYNDVVADWLTGASKSHSSVPQLGFLGRIVRNTGLKNRELTDPDNYAANTNRLDALDEMAVESGRIFLGINYDCISCHNGAGHLETVNLYLSQKTRKEFGQQAAFFGKLRIVGMYNVENNDNIYDNDAKGYDTGNDIPFFTESESKFPRTGQVYSPAFLLTGETPRPGIEPRAEFARLITTNSQFSRATVNLIWSKLMSVGFVEPWDGFDLARLDPQNPPPKPWTIQPNNPALLEALAKDFRDNNYSMHHLMKTIMKSNAYQLSSRFPGEWKEAYTAYYARKYARMLTGPEVIDAIAQASGQAYKFQLGSAEVQRVKQLTDLNDVPGRRGAGPENSNGEGLDITSIMNSFFETNRQNSIQGGNRATTLQAILMMSSGLINRRVLAENGDRSQKLLESGKSDEAIVEELYLATIGRRPTDLEKQKILEVFPFATDRKRSVENLEWSLINSIEFVLNH
jgi:hypothetical protein